MCGFGTRLGCLVAFFASLIGGLEASAVSFLPVAPANVNEGFVEFDAIYFIEQPLAVPTSTLGVDILVSSLAPGMHSFGNFGGLTGGSVDNTSDFTSWLLHWDTPGLGTTASISGSVTFPREIVAVIVTSSLLDGSDLDLGSPTTTYPAGNARRGLELGSDIDVISFVKPMVGAGPFTLDFTFQTRNNVDQIRVLTQPIPEPGAPLVLAASSLVVALRARWRAVRGALPPGGRASAQLAGLY